MTPLLLAALAALPCVYWTQGIESRAGARSGGRQAPLRGAGTGRCLARRRVLGQPARRRRSSLARERCLCPASRRARASPPPRAARGLSRAAGDSRDSPRPRSSTTCRQGKAALAAAEAFAYGADAVLKIDPADLGSVGAMLTFLEASAGERSSGARRLRGRGRWLAHHRRGDEPAGAPQPPATRSSRRPSAQFRINIAIGIRRLPAGGGRRPKRVRAEGPAPTDRRAADAAGVWQRGRHRPAHRQRPAGPAASPQLRRARHRRAAHPAARRLRQGRGARRRRRTSCRCRILPSPAGRPNSRCRASAPMR